MLVIVSHHVHRRLSFSSGSSCLTYLIQNRLNCTAASACPVEVGKNDPPRIEEVEVHTFLDLDGKKREEEDHGETRDHAAEGVVHCLGPPLVDMEAWVEDLPGMHSWVALDVHRMVLLDIRREEVLGTGHLVAVVRGQSGKELSLLISCRGTDPPVSHSSLSPLFSSQQNYLFHPWTLIA